MVIIVADFVTYCLSELYIDNIVITNFYEYFLIPNSCNINKNKTQ